LDETRAEQMAGMGVLQNGKDVAAAHPVAPAASRLARAGVALELPSAALIFLCHLR